MVNSLVKFLAAISIACISGHSASAADKDSGLSDASLNAPFCDTQRVLNKVIKQFRKKNTRYNDPNIELAKIENVGETAALANPKNQTDRRFCEGTATLTNGTESPVYYLIQEREGLASLSWGVEHCVIGEDLEREHGADCRSLRAPF